MKVLVSITGKMYFLVCNLSHSLNDKRSDKVRGHKIIIFLLTGLLSIRANTKPKARHYTRPKGVRAMYKKGTGNDKQEKRRGKSNALPV